MESIQLRPRFKDKSFLPEESIAEAMKVALEKRTFNVRGKIVDHHIHLSIPKEEQHYWSPELHLEITTEENTTYIRGILGPSSQVWLMFVFFYSLLGFIALMIFLIGMAQYNLGISTKIFWGIPLVGLVTGLMYLSAYWGQKRAKDQTERLMKFYHSVISH